LAEVDSACDDDSVDRGNGSASDGEPERDNCVADNGDRSIVPAVDREAGGDDCGDDNGDRGGVARLRRCTETEK
jgi:hypothetical protein